MNQPGKHPGEAFAQQVIELIEHIKHNGQQFAANFQRITQPLMSHIAAKDRSLQFSKRVPQLASLSASHSSDFLGKPQPTVSREDVGRAVWTFLHALAAQYPEKPTRQQQKDVKQLVDVLTRMYPCRECAEHFKEVVREHPPKVANHRDFELWMCTVHNVVNRSLGKPTFNCDLVASRWGALDCDENACALDWGDSSGSSNNNKIQ